MDLSQVNWENAIIVFAIGLVIGIVINMAGSSWRL